MEESVVTSTSSTSTQLACVSCQCVLRNSSPFQLNCAYISLDSLDSSRYTIRKTLCVPTIIIINFLSALSVNKVISARRKRSISVIDLFFPFSKATLLRQPYFFHSLSLSLYFVHKINKLTSFFVFSLLFCCFLHS